MAGRKEIAGLLCFGDGFYSLDDESAKLQKLLDGEVPFRRIHVRLADWASPSNLESSLHSSWLFYYHSLVWADPLRRAYLATGDETYLRALVQHISQWTERHGTFPEPPPTSKHPGDYSWYDMSTAWRSIVLLGVFSVLPEEHDANAGVLAALTSHASALKDERFYAGIGNHALHQNNALLSLGLVLTDEHAISTALDRYASLLAISVDEQGVALEGSPAYHLFNLIWWEEAKHRLAVARELRPEVGIPVIPPMTPFLRDSIAPDGKFVLLGDTTLSHKPLLTVMGDKYPKQVINQLSHDPELLYVLTSGKEGIRPHSTTSLYKDGFWYSRSTWATPFSEQSMVSVRFGAGMQHRVHSHQDAGSVTYYPRSIRLIEDGGLFGYYGGRNRNFVKSQAAHNVIIVDDSKYYITGESPLDDATDADIASMVRVNVRTIEKCRWHRTVVHGKGVEMLLVQDIVKTGDQRRITQNWNLGDDATIERVLGDRIDVSMGQLNAAIFLLGFTDGIDIIRGQDHPQVGWRSSFEGQIKPVYTVRAKHSGPDAKMLMCCVPLAPGQPFSDLVLIGHEFRTNETLVHFTSSGKKTTVAFGQDGVKVY